MLNRTDVRCAVVAYMFSTKGHIVKFERRPPPQRSNKLVFPAIVFSLAASVFASVIYWPAPSRRLAQSATHTSQAATPQASEIQASAIQAHVPPTQTTRTSTHQGAGATFRCTVTTIYDGDGPIHCREGQSIRLHAIAAREMDETCRRGHPCPSASGASAKRELQNLALGHVLRCEQTGTSYNRVTAICWTETGLELNCAMVRSGKALRWDSYNRQRSICS